MTCSRCGKKQTADRMVYSNHTGHRYCRDFHGCDRRKTQREKKQTSPPRCECHNESMYWHPDKRRPSGGSWRCRVRHNEIARRSNKKCYAENPERRSGRVSVTIDELRAELAKCDLRCRWCHSQRHARQRAEAKATA